MVTVWLMKGTHLLQTGAEIPTPPGPGWEPSYTGDINGDGSSDVTWENTSTRRFMIWYMAGTTLLRTSPEIPTPDGL